MKAISFPFHFDETGRVAFTTDPVRAAMDRIRLLAMTSPMERVMIPSYGGGASNYLFEDNDEGTYVLFSSALSDQLEQFEPDIVVDDVEVGAEDNDLTEGFYVEVLFRLQEQGESEGMIQSAVIDVGGSVSEVV